MNVSAEVFKKTFSVNTDISSVKFQNIEVEPYKSLSKDQQFGEKISLLYTTNFEVYHIGVSLKILCFVYESHTEILKLDISIQNEFLSREITACRNFLQRKRNLDLTFTVLLKCMKLFEMRRLICETVFKRQPGVSVKILDTGIVINCYSPNLAVKYLEICWNIGWNIDEFEVIDDIEFYCKNCVLEKHCGEKIRCKLHILSNTCMEFQSKLKLWKSLMSDVYESGFVDHNSKKLKGRVFEISDSDSDDSVVLIDKSTNDEQGNDEILVIE